MESFAFCRRLVRFGVTVVMIGAAVLAGWFGSQAGANGLLHLVAPGARLVLPTWERGVWALVGATLVINMALD